ncbi:MAG: hypothetical protein ACYTEE_09360 [Planctomycetota bacterium]|jgi:hypothetical protein
MKIRKCILFIVVLLSVQVYAAEKIEIRTARLDYYQVKHDPNGELVQIRKHEVVVDYEKRRARIARTDLLADESETWVMEKTYSMMFDGTSLLLTEAPQEATILDSIYLGIVPERLKERDSIAVEYKTTNKKRFKKIETKRNGKVHTQIFAENYVDVDGIPFPMVHRDRSYFNGKFKEETLIFDSVKLNCAISEDDFKLTVPADTLMQETIMTMTGFVLEEGGVFGIKDLLEYAVANQ